MLLYGFLDSLTFFFSKPKSYLLPFAAKRKIELLTLVILELMIEVINKRKVTCFKTFMFRDFSIDFKKCKMIGGSWAFHDQNIVL